MMIESPTAWLRHWAEKSPDAPALKAQERTYSYAELDGEIEARARALIAGGTLPGTTIGAVLDRAETLLLTGLAAFRAGLPFFPLNPKLPAEAIGKRLATAGVCRVVSEKTFPGIETLAPDILARPATGETLHPLAAESIHLLIATSGSTGEAKSVMLSGANLAGAVTASRRRIPLEPGDRWACPMSLSAIGGFSIPLRCFEAGATCRLFEGFSAETVARALSAGEITHISLVPAMLSALLDLGCRPAPALRCALIGGAALSQAVAERAWAAGWPILPSYGMSETASQVATHSEGPTSWQPGLAGRPLPGTQIVIGETGRIRIKGPSVMAGYANPSLAPGNGLAPDGWFETNDLGRIDETGRLFVLGRADDVLVSAGYNIHPLEVEHLASRCPGLEAVAVTARADPVWGERLVAVIVGAVTPEDFLAWCRKTLPSHLRPREAMAVPRLPSLPSGKLDRAQLRRMAEGMDSQA